MSKSVLVFDGSDTGNFFLSLESGVISVGHYAGRPDGVLRGLRIARIHCELDIDQDLVVVTPAPGAAGEMRKVGPGPGLDLGYVRLKIETTTPAAEPGSADASILPTDFDDLAGLKVEEPAAAAASPTSATLIAQAGGEKLVKRFKVIDGANMGQSFQLPESGTSTIGKSHKHAEWILHDLYVSRVHCQLKVEGDKVTVTHIEGANGTLVNGTAIKEPRELRIGDVLRVGNTQLKFELAKPSEIKSSKPEPEEEEVAEEKPAPRADPADTLGKLQGQVLGHYKLGQMLGSGHGGAVFRAQETTTREIVALKVLCPDFPANAAELQHFVGAMKLAPQLQHPHLVTFLNAGKTGHYCWIAREYVEGEDVAQQAHRLHEAGKLKWVKAARLAVQLARVLLYLRAKNVVHGNITPANVLIRAEDKATKLADLMLIKGLKGSQMEAAIRERKQHAELAYYAPELTEDDAAPSALTDLYAVGSVAYLLLTGKAPFVGRDDEQLRARVQGLKPEKPSKYQPNVPASFEAAILKLMAKRPEERFQSPKSLLAELEPICEEHNVET